MAQRLLLERLPPHLPRMALIILNTACGGTMWCATFSRTGSSRSRRWGPVFEVPLREMEVPQRHDRRRALAQQAVDAPARQRGAGGVAHGAGEDRRRHGSLEQAHGDAEAETAGERQSPKNPPHKEKRVSPFGLTRFSRTVSSGAAGRNRTHDPLVRSHQSAAKLLISLTAKQAIVPFAALSWTVFHGRVPSESLQQRRPFHRLASCVFGTAFNRI